MVMKHIHREEHIKRGITHHMLVLIFHCFSTVISEGLDGKSFGLCSQPLERVFLCFDSSFKYPFDRTEVFCLFIYRNLQAAIGAYYDFESPNISVPSMSFVEDVTIGEGESIPPDTQFVKTWRIQNSGKYNENFYVDWFLVCLIVF